MNAELAARVAELLDASPNATVHPGPGGWVALLATHVYPESAARDHPMAGPLRVLGPDGRRWESPLLRGATGTVAWATHAPWLGGALVTDDGVRPWLADPEQDAVVVGDVPVLPAAGVAFAGDDLILTVPATHEGTRGRHWCFEATPGDRVRVLPTAVLKPMPDGRVERWNPHTGRRDDLGLPAAQYVNLRTSGQGTHLAAYATTGDGGVIHLAELAGGRRRQIELADGWVVHYAFGPSARDADPPLVVLHATADGFTVTVHHLDGRSRVVCERAGYPLARRSPGEPLTIFTHATPGAPDPETMLVVTEETVTSHQLPPGARAPLWTERHGAVRRCVADAGDHLLLWETPLAGPDTDTDEAVVEAVPTARRVDIDADTTFVRVRDWERGTVDVTVDGEHVHTLPDSRPQTTPDLPRPTEIRLSTPEGTRAELTVYLPDRDVERGATLVWLHVRRAQPGQAPAPAVTGEARPVAVPAMPFWLTLAGHPVVSLALPVAWWPDVPDEEIRPRIAAQITEALTGGGLADHVDMDRLAVGGHSFGATVALVALADTGLFRAAIVHSGAYSRQLTPLGFHFEDRTMWEAPTVYRDFDALARARDIDKPVLVVHGANDTNPATPVTQACLLFQSLTANGTPSRLVIVPREDHGIVTRDGVRVVLAEHHEWLTRWLPGGGAEDPAAAADASAVEAGGWRAPSPRATSPASPSPR